MKRIYLDNCCFNRPFDDQFHIRVRIETEAKLDIQEQILSGNVALVWSYVLDFENAANPFIERKQTIAQWRKKSVEDICESISLIELAENMSGLGIKSVDALHIACAIEGKCDYFLTTDDGVLRYADKVTAIQIIDPVTALRGLDE